MPNAIIRSSLTLKWNALKPFFRPICVSKSQGRKPYNVCDSGSNISCVYIKSWMGVGGVPDV